MDSDTKGKLFIVGLAVIAGFVYLQSQNIKESGKTLRSDTAKQLIKSTEAVINMPEKTLQIVAKETGKLKNWIFKD